MTVAGRKPMDTLTIYKYGVVRLPANYMTKIKPETRLAARCSKTELRIFLANGEPGFKPNITSGSKSGVINLSRVFRLAAVDPERVAGSYKPTVRNQVLKVQLKGA